jgi:NAD(P)-dependent dehydrogenase (short-subunit alcohol dehydrogenase family)
MSGRLANQVAWISGAASGMGEGIARLFAAEGASVMLADIQTTKGRTVDESIRQLGGKSQFSQCDVTQESQVRASLDATAERFGGIQIIVNCAGIVQVKQLQESTEADWDRVMNVNVKSIFFAIKHGIEHLRRQRRSYVVNIGSVGSFIGQSSTPAYTASKGAVLQLSRSIALDYAADGVRCNCICPGITDTPMLREHLNKSPDPEAKLAERLRRVPMGISLTPDDIARAALYFSCEDSAGVTGTSLIVDGGYLAAAEWEHPGRTKFMEGR